MYFAYLDASALAKRYVREIGSPVVRHLFRRVPYDRIVIFAIGLAEVVSLLVRKHNGDRISAATFRQALRDFPNDVGTTSPVRIVDVDRVMAEAAYLLIARHSINSTDAILLRSALDLAVPLRAAADDLQLVSCDQLLLKAAQAEGLATFRPEFQSTADLDAILGP